MDNTSLDTYKNDLINYFVHEYDNNRTQRDKRSKILSEKYSDEFLESVITGTEEFVKKILKLSENDYFGYIKIPLEEEPKIIYLSLDLVGGWMSDTIVRDTDNNFYSINLLKKIFGTSFIIEPSSYEIIEEPEEDKFFSILSEIYSYYLYIQCKKEILDNVRQHFCSNNKIKKLT